MPEVPSESLLTIGLPSPMRWRRLDVPGREESLLEQTVEGWRISGTIEVEEGGFAAKLSYVIDCDPSWHTRSADVLGEANGKPVEYRIVTDGQGNWTLDGKPLPHLAGAEDSDFAFTPATNTLLIRRLGLAVGQSASVRTAWLRFPELRLEALEQSYTREAERVYRYRAMVDGEPFTARLDVDGHGRVLRYEGLWEVEDGGAE
jgi:hypothetical protein